MSMTELQEKFVNEGYDEDFVVRRLLPTIGLPSIPRDHIKVEYCALGKGKEVRSTIYTIAAYSSDGRCLGRFIAKDILREGDNGEYEKRYLKFFNGPEVLHHDHNRRRLILESWDGSVDELLVNMYYTYRNSDKKGKAQIRDQVLNYMVYIIERLVYNALEGEKKKQELEFDVGLRTRSAENYQPRLLEHLTNLFLLHASNGQDTTDPKIAREAVKWSLKYLNQDAIGEANSLASYLSRQEAVIHFDPNTSNVLFNRRNRNDSPINFDNIHRNGDLEFTLTDFEDVRKGPLSLDLATVVNDFYFHLFDITTREREERFNHGMELGKEIWAQGTTENDLAGIIKEEFIKGTVSTILKFAGEFSKFVIDNPKEYKKFIDKRPLEKKEVVIPKLMSLLLVTCRDTYKFPYISQAIASIDERFKVGHLSETGKDLKSSPIFRSAFKEWIKFFKGVGGDIKDLSLF